jgi:hypothetical protein
MIINHTREVIDPPVAGNIKEFPVTLIDWRTPTRLVAPNKTRVFLPDTDSGIRIVTRAEPDAEAFDTPSELDDPTRYAFTFSPTVKPSATSV